MIETDAISIGLFAWLLLASAVVLLLVGFIMWLHERGISPLRDVSRILHRPWFEVSLLVFLVGGVVQYGSTKGTNGVDRGTLIGLMRGPAPTVVPVAVDSTGFSLPTNFPTITNLCFWGIEHGNDVVSLGIAWPRDMVFTNGCIDIFGNCRLASNGWARIAQLDVSQIGSNAIVEFAYSDLPTNAMYSAAFYRMASQDDTDGDGLSDKVEEWILGTNPIASDTDDDGLFDGDEVELDSDPQSVDSDADGIDDGDEVGYIKVADQFIWYDTSTLIATYNNGYWYEETGLGLYGWWCESAYQFVSSSHVVCGLPITCLTAFETGYISFLSTGDYAGWICPPAPTSLNRNVNNSGSYLVAAYWNDSYLYNGNTNSYIRAGTVADGTFVVEFHDVRTAPYSSLGMTYQVSVPPGTGNVFRVSYLASDYWMDGEGAVVGVQNKRIVTTNGYYNLTWNFSERGPILQRTTVEYHMGYGTNPAGSDTDGDGLDDSFEISVSHSSPLSADGDGDGLSDVQEYAIGTNPMSVDSDGDGLPDKWEHENGLNPLSSAGSDGWSGDPDGDGLNNGREKSLGTSPNSVDTDGDDVDDATEISLGTNPSNADTDCDGLNDGLEVSIGTSPLLSDSDYDGLSDSQERTIGTTPTQPDTDGDGMDDFWEWTYRAVNSNGSGATFDPLVNNSNDDDARNDVSADPDMDGLTNGRECELGTNPNAADTDGDGVNDGAELAQNSDPNDASDLGVANSRVILRFYFGDHSDSHSEKYCLRLIPVTGSGPGELPRSHSHVNANYGECETNAVALVPGWKYEVTLCHAGTNREDGPDYDYTLMSTGSIPSNVTIVDSSSLFGIDDSSSTFAGSGKIAYVSIHAVTGVCVCDPDDSSWTELAASRVILDDENLRIKVEIQPPVSSLSQCCQMFGDNVIVKTSGTCPSGAFVPLGDDATLVNSAVKSEIRITKTRQQLISLGLLPSSDDDGVDERSAHDEGPEVDSAAFLQGNACCRGWAVVASTGNLKSTPPISIPSEAFFKAAGSEVVNISYAGYFADPRQVMNQADVFYYSGHGSSSSGNLKGPNGGSFSLSCNVVSGWWTRDLDCVIFSACSVLDINDYNGNYGDSTGSHSHGEEWENVGPATMLGYNYIAPGDAGGATSRIISAWRNNRSSGDVDAWMAANGENRAWNACAIVKGRQYLYFKRRRWGRRSIMSVNKGDW